MDRSMSVRPKLLNPIFFTVVAMESIEDGLLQYFFYLEHRTKPIILSKEER
jgi:hypothetical protein